MKTVVSRLPLQGSGFDAGLAEPLRLRAARRRRQDRRAQRAPPDQDRDGDARGRGWHRSLPAGVDSSISLLLRFPSRGPPTSHQIVISGPGSRRPPTSRNGRAGVDTIDGDERVPTPTPFQEPDRRPRGGRSPRSCAGCCPRDDADDVDPGDVGRGASRLSRIRRHEPAGLVLTIARRKAIDEYRTARTAPRAACRAGCDRVGDPRRTRAGPTDGALGARSRRCRPSSGRRSSSGSRSTSATARSARRSAARRRRHAAASTRASAALRRPIRPQTSRQVSR